MAGVHAGVDDRDRAAEAGLARSPRNSRADLGGAAVELWRQQQIRFDSGDEPGVGKILELGGIHIRGDHTEGGQHVGTGFTDLRHQLVALVGGFGPELDDDLGRAVQRVGENLAGHGDLGVAGQGRPGEEKERTADGYARNGNAQQAPG